MRTSRVSRETSKVINATTALESSTRRTTRSSLARFTHNGLKTEEEGLQNNNDTTASLVSTDIEDAVSGPLKRKRHLSSRALRSASPKTNTKTKVKTEEEVFTTTTIAAAPSKAAAAANRRVRKPARAIKDPTTGEVSIHPPSDWAEVYALVKEMRTHGAAAHAAVDTMGCESYAASSATEVSARDKRYHTLTALMLSSQTKDVTNAAAMALLQRSLPAHTPGAAVGLNLENVLAVAPETLNALIRIVGFHNNKTRYIKAAAVMLRDQFAGDIPDTVEGLMSLPGVGPKMAYLCLSSAWGRTEGIGVDVHVHRITNLWGWNAGSGGSSGTKGPEETRLALQRWLPRELWHEINWLLVGFGQTVCLPVGRRCGECEVGLRGLCKSADRAKVVAGRRVKEELLIKRDGDGKEAKKVKTIKEEVVLEDKVVNAPPNAGVAVEGQEEELA